MEGTVLIPPDLYIDFKRGKFLRGNNEWTDTTSQSLQLLEYFVEHEGEIVTHDEIIQMLYAKTKNENTAESYKNNLRSEIGRTRKFLEGTEKKIENKRGLGYYYCDRGKAADSMEESEPEADVGQEDCTESEDCMEREVIEGSKVLEESEVLKKSEHFAEPKRAIQQPAEKSKSFRSLFGPAIQKTFTRRDLEKERIVDSFIHTEETVEGRSQDSKERQWLNERCETLDVLCGILCETDTLEFAIDSLQCQIENIDCICQKIGNHVCNYCLSVSEAEKLCNDYDSYVILKINKRKNEMQCDYEDGLRQYKIEAMEIMKCYFRFRILDALLFFCEESEKRSEMKNIDKKFCGMMKKIFQKEYEAKEEEYYQLDRDFRGRVIQKTEDIQSAGMIK